MSWLGKIMAFLVLIASVVWMALTVNVYVTRTNWKARVDAAEKALKESEANRRTELNDSRSDREKLVRLLEAERSRTTDLNKSHADLSASSSKSAEDFKKLTDNYAAVEQSARLAQAQLTGALAELQDVRKRNTALEDNRVQLVLAKETAERERLRAENDAKLSRAIADDNAGRVAALQAQVTELKQSGGSTTAAVLRNVNKVPAPLPDNIRGTVTRDIAGEFVEISIGIDAGLEPGSRLDVYRETNGGQYLGTLVVTKSVYPKSAVAEFRPARQVSLAQLRPEELPRKGDQVGIISTGVGSRPNP